MPDPISQTPLETLARDLIVIGASAGGVEALSLVVQGLPADLPACVFVVLHVPRHGASVLAQILSRRGPLSARVPDDGEAIRHGQIYVAPPDRHLILEDGHVRVSPGPSENGHRPAIDPLFRSAARAGRRRVIGVILSGTLDDGTAGLGIVKRCGGTTIVQDPDDALFNGMPRSAMENVPVDHVVPASEIGPLLARLVAEPLPARTPDSEETDPMTEPSAHDSNQAEAALSSEVEAALMDPEALNGENRPGFTPSVFACPECGGVLWEVQAEGMTRYRCRTGHAYSPDSLLAVQNDALEAALWTALRALEESGSLARRLRDRAVQRGHGYAQERFARQADEADTRAAIVRHALIAGQETISESQNVPSKARNNGTSPSLDTTAA